MTFDSACDPMPQSSVRAELLYLIPGLAGVSTSTVHRRLKPYGGVDGLDEHGATPLILALSERLFVRSEGMDAIQRLLDAGACVTAHHHGASPLWWALFAHRDPSGHGTPAPMWAIVEVCRRLLAAGAEVAPTRHHPSHPGMPPLHEAARAGADAVALLLAHGARPHDRNHQGDDALAAAVTAGRIDSLDALMDDGADLGRSSLPGSTLVHLALRTFNAPMVARLLEHAADPNRADSLGRTPLQALCEPARRTTLSEENRQDAQQTLSALLDHDRTRVQVTDQHGNTPLHDLARSYAHRDWAIMLIEHGADPHEANDRGDTPLDRFRATLKDEQARGTLPSQLARDEQRWHDAIVVHLARSFPAAPSVSRRRL